MAQTTGPAYFIRVTLKRVGDLKVGDTFYTTEGRHGTVEAIRRIRYAEPDGVTFIDLQCPYVALHVKGGAVERKTLHPNVQVNVKG